MNISLNRMMEINSIQQPNVKPGLNPEGMGGLDNFMFDSLLDNFSSEAFARKPREISRTSERPEIHSSINNENDRRAYDKIDRHAEANGRVEKQDSYEGGIRAEAGEDTEGREAAAYIKDNSPKIAVEEVNAGQHESLNETEGEAAIDDSFADLLNNNDDEEVPVTGLETAPVQAENNAEEINDPKTDAIISDLLNSHNDEVLKNVEEEFQGQAAVEVQAENSVAEQETDAPAAERGLKGDKLFSGRLNENIDDPLALQQDGAEDDEALKNETVLKEAGTSGSRDKGNMVSDMLAEASKTSGNKDSDAVDQARIDNLLKNMNRNTASARTEHGESFSPSDENIDGGDGLADEFQFGEEMPEGDLHAESNNAKILMKRAAAGFMENTAGESVSKVQAVKPAVQIHTGSGNSNAGMLNSSAFMHSNGKISEGLHNVNSAKAPAFTDIVDKVVYVAKSGNRLGVTLDHAELGKLHINLRLQKGLVNIQINAPDRITGEYVENNIQKIVSSLEEQGITVGGFSVALKDNRNHEGYGHWNRRSYNSFNEKKTEYAVEPQIVNSAGGASSMLSIFA